MLRIHSGLQAHSITDVMPHVKPIPPQSDLVVILIINFELLKVTEHALFSVSPRGPVYHAECINLCRGRE